MATRTILAISASLTILILGTSAAVMAQRQKSLTSHPEG